MLNACALTIVRNGDDYLRPVIDRIAPFVSSVRIWVDSRSDDDTWYIARTLAQKYKNVAVKHFYVSTPLFDLVDMRNDQLTFREPWGFIVDSDELHHDIEKYHFGNESAYSFMSWSPWDMERGHKASQRAIIGRVFRNVGKLEWRGLFGKEILYRGEKKVFDEATLLPYRYIHFTHLKKDTWRAELNQQRVADDRALSPLPPDIINIIKNVNELQTV